MLYAICSLTPPHPLSLLYCVKQSTWKTLYLYLGLFSVSCPVSSFLLIKRSFISLDAATRLLLAGPPTNQRAGMLFKGAVERSTWGQRSSGRCQQVACCNIHVYLSSTLSTHCQWGLPVWYWHHCGVIAWLRWSAKCTKESIWQFVCLCSSPTPRMKRILHIVPIKQLCG